MSWDNYNHNNDYNYDHWEGSHNNHLDNYNNTLLFSIATSYKTTNRIFRYYQRCVYQNLKSISARFTQELFSCPNLCSCQANVYHVNCIQMTLTEPPANLPVSANLLDLRLNNIEILNELAFSGLSELASLHLDLNSIMTIRQGAFRGLKNLIYLYLSNNQIRKFYQNSNQFWFPT